MKITVFTSNQPRHLSLIEELSKIADEVFAVQECNTVFPGKVADFFKKSEIMQDYFSRVINAEREVFGEIRPLNSRVRQLALKMGDLNLVPFSTLEPMLKSDYFIVFGASYIKGELIDFLVSKGALNIHMGTSPYYRGSSCNFWALYDRRPEYVGATIHYLSKGLDSGPMLFHALPKPEAVDGFLLGMRSVQVAHRGLIQYLSSGATYDRVSQDKAKLLRYTKNIDFNDVVAKEYLERMPAPGKIKEAVASRELSRFLKPFVG